MSKSSLTLVAAVALGGVAAADTGRPVAVDMSAGTLAVSGSRRGVAQDYLVLPSGSELTAQMRFVTADAMQDGEKLKFTDLALFGISGRVSLHPKLELAGSVELLPKQPSYTDEKVWQSVRTVARFALGKRFALAASGAGGPLMSHEGGWWQQALSVEWKKPIHDELLAFHTEAGVAGLGLVAPDTNWPTAFLTEVSARTTALFREPRGHWGAWIGIGYAVPVQRSGRDPTTDLAIDPQPRLDFRMGTVLSLVERWDLYVNFAILDRGDFANPATRLPILDGGFDQKQIVFGVTRHFERPRRDSYVDEDGYPLQLGSL